MAYTSELWEADTRNDGHPKNGGYRYAIDNRVNSDTPHGLSHGQWGRLALFRNREDRDRALVCVNACSGIAHPEELRTVWQAWNAARALPCPHCHAAYTDLPTHLRERHHQRSLDPITFSVIQDALRQAKAELEMNSAATDAVDKALALLAVEAG